MHTTINKALLLSFLITLLLIGCDCQQRAEGVVLDKATKETLCNVALGRYKKEDPNNSFTTFQYTNDKGHFDFHGISGGLFGCPSLTLYFSKEGYKPTELKYNCSKCFTLDTIYLEKQ